MYCLTILEIDAMTVFLGTLIIVGLSCLAMSLGLLIAGRPLAGGCGNKPPGTPKCEGCPKRKRQQAVVRNTEGESGC
jgi:hypothetical protein